MKNTTSKEDSEQMGFIRWFREKFPDTLIFHIPNGEFRNISVGLRLKELGVVRGIPDLFVPGWKLWMEFKRKKGGVVSEDQEKIIEYLSRHGYIVYICYGAEDASRKVLDFWNEMNKKN